MVKYCVEKKKKKLVKGEKILQLEWDNCSEKKKIK